MFLSQVPSEIIHHIVGYLPTAGCVLNLLQTCSSLYHTISADNYRVFQAFTQSKFPAIETRPLWRDAARALTTRSRACDRGAVVARYVLPARDARRIGQSNTVRTDRPTLGYRPPIDSYESWHGETWFDRREVLVWGAGADLIIRVKDYGNAGPLRHDGRAIDGPYHPNEKWALYNDLQDVNSWDDILGVHLLHSDQLAKYVDGEEVIIARRNGKLHHMSISPHEGSYATKKSYLTNTDRLEATDMSTGPDKVIAATLGDGSIAFFKAEAEGDDVESFSKLDAADSGTARNRCSKLLSDERIAVGVDGGASKISIFDLTRDNLTNVCDIATGDFEAHGTKQKARVTAFEPLSTTTLVGGRPGDLFLSGWQDSTVRLHDIRSPRSHVYSFPDIVDQSPTYCLRAMGRERFIAGAGENALVKIVDLRMPGRYDYLDAGTPAVQTYYHRHASARKHSAGGLSQADYESVSYPRKDISIFLSQRHESTYTSRTRGNHKYRGPIYAISHPSPSSSNFYVGVEGGIIGFNMANTDDLIGPHADWYIQNDDLSAEISGKGSGPPPIPLTCYERPGPEDRTKRLDLLYQGRDFSAFQEGGSHADDTSDCLPGWDCRWTHLPGRAMIRRVRSQ